MGCLGLLCLIALVPVGGAFLKWSVHITHTWFPFVPEIPYGTACLSVFATLLGAVVLGLIAMVGWGLISD